MSVDPSRVLVVAATKVEAAYVPEHLELVLSGIGKVEAATVTAAAIARSRPELVLNVGTAGALSPGLTGLFLPSTVVNHDYSADAVRALGHDAVDEIEIAGGDGTVLATGDLFVTDPAVRDALAQRAHLVDMEGFAVARAAQLAGVPCRLVKIVSDAADDSALEWSAVVDACARLIGHWVRDEIG
ncbi:nucleosidase [Aeromicrobium duanguangcaii]|uniref:Nucleosidase n=1 Tax=Aeromicrobium duanguangcaii TaxID=2968086 RepID=A0ABY5KJJ7_9ACTN|nr:nucleosidase [Aeromicrobium duanguangcaii]MCD9153595.1 nucleosidase [Aeromicrobium duanguangcaii]UUI69322.1 nucleosidase [Aeromicrobium duanguangcaii]